MTIAEVVHRVEFELREALKASERGDDEKARHFLVEAFYTLDALLDRLREERPA